MKFKLFLLAVVFLQSWTACASTNFITFTNGSPRFIAARFTITPTPYGARVIKTLRTFDPTFHTYTTITFGAGWSPATPTFSRGEGCIMIYSQPLAIYDEPNPLMPLPLPAGYSLVACQSNLVATFEMIVGRAPDEGTKVLRWISDQPVYPFESTNYNIYTFSGGVWSPEEPIADIGEALWVFQPPKLSNVEILQDNTLVFDVLGCLSLSGGTDVEYCDPTAETPIWNVLTSIPGNVSSLTLTNNLDLTTAPQRLYRLNIRK